MCDRIAQNWGKAMLKYAQPYVLIKRKTTNGKIIWYYRLRGERTKHSTGTSVKYEAVDYVETKVLGQRKAKDQTPGSYAQDFYVWDRCEWIMRQRAKGKPFSISMAKIRRGHLENYLLPRFGNLFLSDLNAVEIENWIISLPRANGTKNAILHSLNIILREAKRERLILANPVDDGNPFLPTTDGEISSPRKS
jgi:hypothetical protein